LVTSISAIRIASGQIMTQTFAGNRRQAAMAWMVARTASAFCAVNNPCGGSKVYDANGPIVQFVRYCRTTLSEFLSWASSDTIQGGQVMAQGNSPDRKQRLRLIDALIVAGAAAFAPAVLSSQADAQVLG
jgi:hypothetical protein